MATHDLKQIWFNREINQRLEEVLRGIAASHLNLVENGMRFQNLKQDKRILRLANGIVIESSICFGKQTSRVYVPPVPPVKKRVVEEEVGFGFILTRDIDGVNVDLDKLNSIIIYRQDRTIAFRVGGSNISKYYGTWSANEEETIWTFAPSLQGINYKYNVWTYNTITNMWVPEIPEDFIPDPDGKYFAHFTPNFDDEDEYMSNVPTYYPHVYSKAHYWDEENLITFDQVYEDTLVYFRVETRIVSNTCVYEGTDLDINEGYWWHNGLHDGTGYPSVDYKRLDPKGYTRELFTAPGMDWENRVSVKSSIPYKASVNITYGAYGTGSAHPQTRWATEDWEKIGIVGYWNDGPIYNPGGCEDYGVVHLGPWTISAPQGWEGNYEPTTFHFIADGAEFDYAYTTPPTTYEAETSYDATATIEGEITETASESGDRVHSVKITNTTPASDFVWYEYMAPYECIYNPGTYHDGEGIESFAPFEYKYSCLRMPLTAYSVSATPDTE